MDYYIFVYIINLINYFVVIFLSIFKKKKKSKFALLIICVISTKKKFFKNFEYIKTMILPLYFFHYIQLIFL